MCKWNKPETVQVTKTESTLTPIVKLSQTNIMCVEAREVKGGNIVLVFSCYENYDL